MIHIACLPAPICPFCRNSIAKLMVSKGKTERKSDKEINFSKMRRSNFSEGSSSF
uniref:Uncharacterized protein n=1 Tax=Nelumbo nucifera TaxID=4432 RepID=A0A822YJZ1_NELNU|nr:TPA_asm: hypothetical protein HUJ06_010136 [Nelumbo nucifera]